MRTSDAVVQRDWSSLHRSAGIFFLGSEPWWWPQGGSAPQACCGRVSPPPGCWRWHRRCIRSVRLGVGLGCIDLSPGRCCGAPAAWWLLGEAPHSPVCCPLAAGSTYVCGWWGKVAWAGRIRPDLGCCGPILAMGGGRGCHGLLCGGARLHPLYLPMRSVGDLLTWVKPLLWPEPAVATLVRAAKLLGGIVVMVALSSTRLRGKPLFQVCSEWTMAAHTALHPFLKALFGGRLG